MQMTSELDTARKYRSQLLCKRFHSLSPISSRAWKNEV